jgi:exosortase
MGDNAGMNLRPKWAGTDSRPRLGPILIVALALLLFYPAWRWLVSEWLGNDYYSHGLLVPIVAAVLTWRLWAKWPGEDRYLKGAAPGFILVLVALAVYLCALIQRAYFAASLAMVVVIAGLVWYLLGPLALRRLAFPIAFLLFMVPLPFVEPLSIPLAQCTGAVAAAVVRLFGVPVLVSGSQVTLPDTSLVVGAQCSGMRSIVSLMTLVALLIFVLDGPQWGKLSLALSSVPIAILGNAMRVSSLLVVASVWGAEAGFKYYHDYSGIVFFVSAVVLLFMFSRWARCREIRDDIF